MTTQVPLKRPCVETTDICAGSGVTGGMVRSLAKLVNWILAQGKQTAAVNGRFIAMPAGDLFEFPLITHRKYQTKDRRLAVKCTGANTTVTGEVLVGRGDGVGNLSGGQTRIVGPDYSSPEWQDDGGSSQGQAQTEEEFWLAIDVSVEASLTSTAAWDMPRANLALGNDDLGCDPEAFSAGQPYVRGTNAAIEGAIKALEDETLIGRRHNFLAWTMPAIRNGSSFTTYSLSITSSTFAGVFGNDGIPVLARQLRRGATTSQIRVKIFYLITGGTAEVRAVSYQNGNSSTLTLSSVLPVWSAAMDLDVDCEDLDHDTGLQDHGGDDWDMLNIEARKLSGGTLHIFGVSAWEAGP